MSRRRGAAVEVGRFARANLASGVASALEWVLVSAAIWAGVHYLVAAAAGAITGAVTDFSLKRWWAFDRHRRAPIEHESARYVAASGGSLALNLAVAWALVDGLGANPVAGVVTASVLVGFAWNYPLHRFYVFRDAATGPEPAASSTPTR